MGNKRIILFFLTGIALCLIILLAGRGKRRFLSVPDDKSSYLVRDIFEDISAVVIERAGGRMEIRRSGNRWRMVAPVDASVESGSMKRLLNAFDSVAVRDRLEIDEIKERGLSVSDYGLYPARARVTFLLPEREISFLFGKTVASGMDVYVSRDGLNQVLVVPREVYEGIPQSVDDLRSRRLIDCDPALVSSIAIRRPGHPFIRLGMKDGTWFMEEPLSARASTERIEMFLKNLFGVRVFKFVWPSLDNVMDIADYEKALKMRKGLYGLDEETGTSISIQTLDGSSDASVVLGRGHGAIGDFMYALLDKGRAIGTVSNSFAAVAEVEPEYFRGMRIFEDISGPLERVQILTGRDLFVLSRTNKLWRIDSPVSEAADQEYVQRAIDAILTLKADRILNRVHRDESGDQGVESSYIEFSSGSDVVMGSVRKSDHEGSLFEFEFADRPEVYYVDGTNMPAVLVDRAALLEFRDKTLLSLPATAISRITIKKYGETDFSVEYAKEDQSWHPAAGSLKGRLNQDAFKRVLSLVGGFKADRVVKVGLGVNDLTYYGFAEPWLEINLDLNLEDAVRRSLLVGRAAGGNMRYVMVRGDQSVFLVEEQKLAVFAESLIAKEL